MADEILKTDANNERVIGLVTDDASQEIRMGRIDDATKGLKVVIVGSSGIGTVTSISQSTGILLTPNPITTTGTVGLATNIAPIATLGTAGQSIRVNAGATALEYYTPSSSGLTVGTTTITSGTTTRILYNNAGVLGEYTISGSGTTVAMATAPTFGTSITGSYLTASEILITDGSKNIVSAAVATYPSLTELTYVKGVTSAIQTQITAKAPTASPTFTGTVTIPTPFTLGATSVTSTGTQLNYLSSATGTTGTTSTNVVFSTSPSLTTATLNGVNVLADAAQISLTVPSADATATGFVTSAFNSGYSSSAIGDLVYLDASATWQKADADSTTTAYGLLGIALAVAASGAALKVALPGSFVRLNSWNWTVGNTLYVGETAGAMQNTIPTGADNVIRVVGFAVNADYIYFYPSQDVQTTVA